MGENIKTIAKAETERLFSKIISVQIEVVSKTTHRLWSAWRRYQLVKELEHRLDDELFLRDIGLTRLQVEMELDRIKQRGGKNYMDTLPKK
ncbi:hypothetical protein [Enterovibrio nigricans]|uniref:Uncharacterized protein n=1 Tax=Enterovibrio nigricans DSM 22720 TaxID=1121868 RepID=A0A1T4UDY2_9GAMM|nr:hypothetical protein [Enterovibrio nigricans]PKF50730.1 hypothetical protein AT251_09275 [Enterovibrio nigricans]SKA50790.1 hypothetical protein SAMN02745132_01470 [Enterovibrio nigricans DSM 22720]